MTHIELPRALEAYFAFAELPATGRGRHFTITFTYVQDGRLDRLQWWWQVNRSQERAGEPMLQGLRQEAIQRFRQHIERWLVNSNRRLSGGEPFPELEAPVEARDTPASEPPAEEICSEASQVVALRAYARMAAGR